MATEKPPRTNSSLSIVPSANELAKYAAINPEIPLEMLRARERELQREFRYALSSLGAGVIALLVIVGGYVYLAMNGHPATSGILLGAGVLSLVGGIIRSRLKS